MDVVLFTELMADDRVRTLPVIRANYVLPMTETCMRVTNLGSLGFGWAFTCSESRVGHVQFNTLHLLYCDFRTLWSHSHDSSECSKQSVVQAAT